MTTAFPNTTFTYKSTIISSAWCQAVNDFFAKGVTPEYPNGADDTVHLNATLAGASAGETVFLTAGTYTVSASTLDTCLVIPIGVNLVCAPGAWITSNSTAISLIAPLGNNVLQVNLDGNGFPLSGTPAGVWTRRVIGIRSYLSVPIGLGATNVTIINSVIKNCHCGVQGEGVNTWKILSSNISRTEISGVLLRGLVAYPCSYCLVEGNTFSEHGDTACAFDQGEVNGVVSFNTISSNTALNTQYNANGFAFDFEGANAVGYVYSNKILGNTVRQLASTIFGQGGVVLGLNVSDGVVSDNVLLGNGHNNADVGIAALGVNCLVSGNLINNFQGGAIYTDGATGVLATGNRIHNCGGTVWPYAAVNLALASNTSGVSFVDNYLSWDDSYAHAAVGSVSVGAAVAAGKTVKNIIVKDNTLVNPIDIGIYMIGLVGSKITNATVLGNTLIGGGSLFTGAPIQMAFCDQALVQDNNVKDAKTGFLVQDSVNLRFEGNTLHNSIADVLAAWLDITGSTKLTIDNNEFITAGVPTAKVNPLATLTTGANNNSAKRNRGFVTEATGTSVAIATTATISHGLDVTPTVVTLCQQDATPTAVFPSAFGGTTFVVNYAGGGTHTFGWIATYG